MPAQCRHLRANGIQCRAHRVWKEDYCFFHLHHRTPHGMARHNEEPAPPPPANGIEIPLLEDLSAIQIALGRVLTALAQGKISTAEAHAYITGLRLAAANVKHKDFAPTHTAEAYIQYDNGDTIGPEQFVAEQKPQHPLMDSGLLTMHHLANRLAYEATLDAYLTRGQEPPSTLRPPVAGPPTDKSELQNWIATGWKACQTRAKAIELARNAIPEPKDAAHADAAAAHATVVPSTSPSPIPPQNAFSTPTTTQRTA